MDKLLAQLKEIDTKIDAILAGDALTDESRAALAALESERAKVEERIGLQQKADARKAEREQREAALAAETRSPRSNRITPVNAGTAWEVATVYAEPKDPRAAKTWGFNNFGEFAREVMQSHISGRHTNRMLTAFEMAEQAAATGMGTAVGSDGAYLVPEEFSSRIFSKVFADGNLLARTDIYNVNGNMISFPRIDETSRATGSRSGGVQAYWRGEGATATNTKPKIGKLTLNLHKIMAIGVMTDELIADSPMLLEQFLFNEFDKEINFLVSDSLVNGTGAGMPLGILNAACTVSVNKETGQSAATINATNILKMHARMYAPCRADAVWLINQDVEPQLHSMQIGTGVANQVVYMPPGGLSALPYATLMGKPVIPVEYCATLGTVGDIILVDLKQWVTAVKSGGMQSAVSVHLYFDRDEQAFRMTYRLDSQPWWASALTPFKGSNTQSCAVTLANRT